MRRMILICVASFLVVSSLHAQTPSNVDLQGRWAEGINDALFRRDGYTFIGNGAYLELYRTRNSSYQKLDDILLPGRIQDLWVKNDRVIVALGDYGVQIVGFDPGSETFNGILGSVNTPGFAMSVMQFSNMVYVADREGGLSIIDLTTPSNPQWRSGLSIPGTAQEVWALNDSTILVAAGTQGLYSVHSKSPHTTPALRDSMYFHSIFPQKPNPVAYHVVAIDTTAYVSAGWGGVRIVKVDAAGNLDSLSTWIYAGTPVEVMSIWVAGTNAYVAGGVDGLFSRIDISDPTNPTGPIYLPFDTNGFSSNVVVEQDVGGDTAFVADRWNGHLLINVSSGSQPNMMRSIATADRTYDVDIDGQTLYLAAGKTGLVTFSTVITSPPDERLIPLGSYDTPGEALGVVKVGTSAYVADGPSGLAIVNVSAPADPTLYGSYDPQGEPCLAVDVPAGSYAYMACGSDGLRIVNVSVPSSPFEVFRQPTRNAKNVKVVDGLAYVADSTRVLVYDIAGLPVAGISLVDSLTGSMDAMAVDVVGDSVFIANGQFGILVWDKISGLTQIISTVGRCSDITVKEKTLFITDEEDGLSVYDFSTPGTYALAGYYQSREGASGLDVAGETVAMAGGEDGLYILKSEIKPGIEVLPTALNFGPVPPEYSRPLNVWVINTGTTLLRVTDILTNNDRFKFSQTDFTVAPGDTHSLVVRFEPNIFDVGDVFGSANVYSNADTIPLSLQGRSVSLVTDGPYNPDIFTIGLWHFDEPSGTTASDTSGNGFDGQVLAGVTRTDSSKYGRSLRFNKQTNSRVIVSSDPAFTFANTAFTIELYFQMLSKPDSYFILLKRGISNSLHYEIALANESQPEKGVMAQIRDSQGENHFLHTGSMDEMNTGQWYHVAFTWDRDSLRLFLNAVQRDAKAFRGPLNDPGTEDLGFGASAYGNAPLYGYIDEVKVSGIARQPWEFHVNRSRLLVQEESIDFGDVVIGQSRDVPVTLTNGGSQSLVITDLTTTAPSVSIFPSSAFALGAGQDTTLWLTFTPNASISLEGLTDLELQSSDPTFPVFRLPLYGKGVATIPAGQYAADAFTLGLWHFNELIGSTVYDSSSQGLHGTIYNGVIRSVGQFSNGLGFDGQDDICIVHPDIGQTIGPKWAGFTVEGWVYLDGIPQPQNIGTIVRRSSSLVSQFDLFVTDSATVVGQLYNNSDVMFQVTSTGSNAFPMQQWTHVAMSLLDDTLSLYVNGERADAIPFSGSMADHQSHAQLDTLSVLMGSYWSATDHLSGDLDEIRISGIGRQWWEFNVNMARITISPDSLDFDQVVIGKDRTLKIHVSNPGIETLSVSNINSSNNAYTPNRTDFFVSPGETEILKVSFAPPDTFFQASTLTLVTNDPFMPVQTLILTGEGVEDNPVMAYTPDPFTAGLYHLDEGAGTAMGDSSGNGLNGSFSGGMFWLGTGRFGSAARFNGVNGRISVPFNQSLDFDASDFTIEFWFSMISQPQDRAVLVRRGSASTTQFDLVLDPTEGLIGRLWDASGVERQLTTNLSQGLNLDQWYHAAFTWDGDSVKLFLNNEMFDADTLRGRIRDDALRPIVFGGDTLNQDSFHGDIDEIRISRLARKSWEILVLPRAIEVYPIVLHFATVLVNQSRTLRFWISNLGDQELSISDVSGAVDVFSIPDSLESFTLPRMTARMIPVTYRPDAADTTHQTQVMVYSNDTENQLVSISLEGSGTEWVGPPPPPSVDAHTLALFRFAEAGSDTILDASLNANNGSMNDGVMRTDGFFGRGLYFDGYSGRVRIPYQEDLLFDFQEESFTVECYFRTDTVSQTLMAMGQESAISYGIFITNRGQIQVEGFGNGGPRINDDSWHHIAFSYNHIIQLGKLYIDGSLIWSNYWTDSGVMPGTRPLIIGALEVHVGTYTQYYQGHMDELRISDIVREPWEFQLVDYGITVLSQEPDTVQLGASVTLNVRIPVELDVSSMFLSYRSGGERSYQSLVAELINDTTYQAVIPASAVSLTGLEYYVGVISGIDTVSYPGIDPANNPVALPVQHNGFVSPYITRPRAFRLLSVPYVLDTTSVQATLVDDFGPYDPYIWRFFFWNDADSVYEQFTESTPPHFFTLDPGQAYWLVTDQQMEFDIGSGQSVSTDSSFCINLLPGWNHIGNPFNFPVRWMDNSVSSDSVSTLYAYDELGGYRLDWPQMDPWEGYWIYNADIHNQALYVQPKSSTMAKHSPIPGGVQEGMTDGEWMIKLSAIGERLKDLDNYAGIRFDASQNWDRRDRYEPPQVDERISLYFSSSDISRGRRHAADIREPGKAGYTWELFVEPAADDDQATLMWTITQNLPDDWEAFLFDIEEDVATDVIKHKQVSFNAGDGDEAGRKFRLVVGSRAYIESQSNGIPLVPCEFRLQQNYPNPFNPETIIPYSLPKRGRIVINVYNILGQRLRTIFDGTQRAGHHQILWDGKDAAGRSVPNGLYLCKLEGLGKIATRKMIVLK